MFITGIRAAAVAVSAAVFAIWWSRPEQRINRALKDFYDIHSPATQERITRHLGSHEVSRFKDESEARLRALIGEEGLRFVFAEMRWARILSASDLLEGHFARTAVPMHDARLYS